MPSAHSVAFLQLRFRELDASKSGLAELTRFYRSAYVAEFPDPDERESLANMKRYLALKARGFYGKNNYHIVLAERGDEIVGAAIFDYLARPNAGVIEFLFTTPAARGHGVGRALLDETTRILRRDARTRIGRPLLAITAEMNDPFVRPNTPDNMDPFERAGIWAKWGFAKLDFPYVQPALSPGQEPVTGLVLLAKMMRRADRVPGAWVESVVGEYMRWAMRIPKPERNSQFRAMARWLRARGEVELVPLDRYVGRAPEHAFEIEPVTAEGGVFKRTVALIQREVKGRGRVESSQGFARALAARKQSAKYHLWALRAEGSRTVQGAASFFSLPTTGFGGYLVLAGRLRGRGLLRALIARIERQLLCDGTRAKGWWIECGPEARAAFERVGFLEVPVEYRPPAVGNGRGKGVPERLHLLYKPFGSARSVAVLAKKDIESSIASVLAHVYGVARPRMHACYKAATAQLTERIVLRE